MADQYLLDFGRQFPASQGMQGPKHAAQAMRNPALSKAVFQSAADVWQSNGCTHIDTPGPLNG